MPSAAASTLADLSPLLEELGLRWYVFDERHELRSPTAWRIARSIAA